LEIHAASWKQPVILLIMKSLFLNWHNSLLIQTFTKTGPSKVTLKMKNPNSEGKFEPILEVIFTKK